MGKQVAQGAVHIAKRSSDRLVHAREKLFNCWANIAANACATNNWSHADLAQ